MHIYFFSFKSSTQFVEFSVITSSHSTVGGAASQYGWASLSTTFFSLSTFVHCATFMDTNVLSSVTKSLPVLASVYYSYQMSILCVNKMNWDSPQTYLSFGSALHMLCWWLQLLQECKVAFLSLTFLACSEIFLSFPLLWVQNVCVATVSVCS